MDRRSPHRDVPPARPGHHAGDRPGGRVGQVDGGHRRRPGGRRTEGGRGRRHRPGGPGPRRRSRVPERRPAPGTPPTPGRRRPPPPPPRSPPSTGRGTGRRLGRRRRTGRGGHAPRPRSRRPPPPQAGPVRRRRPPSASSSVGAVGRRLPADRRRPVRTRRHDPPRPRPATTAIAASQARIEHSSDNGVPGPPSKARVPVPGLGHLVLAGPAERERARRGGPAPLGQVPPVGRGQGAEHRAHRQRAPVRGGGGGPGEAPAGRPGRWGRPACGPAPRGAAGRAWGGGDGPDGRHLGPLGDPGGVGVDGDAGTRTRPA